MLLREISPLPIAVDRRDTSWTVTEPLVMLEAGRKKTRYFSYPPRYFSYPRSDRQTHQDQSGRLWDVLFMAAYVARANAEAGPKLRFELYRVLRDGRSTEAELTTLKLIVGPGDDGEPVMTTLLPNED